MKTSVLVLALKELILVPTSLELIIFYKNTVYQSLSITQAVADPGFTVGQKLYPPLIQ